MARHTTDSEPTSRVVGANVRRLRGMMGLSLRELSARMPADHPIRFSALGELERGDRRATVDDLTALALAFGVGVVALLQPHTSRADTPAVAVTGHPQGATPEALLAWLTGFRTIDGKDATRDTLPPWAWTWRLDDTATL